MENLKTVITFVDGSRLMVQEDYKELRNLIKFREEEIFIEVVALKTIMMINKYQILTVERIEQG